jgi:hypothetical protein
MDDVEVGIAHPGGTKRKIAGPVVVVKTEGAKTVASSNKGKAAAKAVPAKVKVRLAASLLECAC